MRRDYTKSQKVYKNSDTIVHRTKVQLFTG